ncbi:hypothetical protein B0H11DRAFT_2229098 [Mycena galericulata]|nr:hypothetical protein B0H11DRAFT_2229098 [Mycena galericulata]
MKRFSAAASDPANLAAGDAFVDRVSAPVDLAARQAMGIKEHMEKLQAAAKSAPTLVAPAPSTGILTPAAGGALGGGAPRTPSDLSKLRSAAYAAPSASVNAFVLSDLENYKANYDASAPCGVSDPGLQDNVLAASYQGLPPLPGGKLLLPAFVQQNDSFDYLLTGGRVSFSLWAGKIPDINFSNSVGGVLFVEAPGGFINPSRVDPRRVTSQPTTADLSRYVLNVDGKTAICVSAIMASESTLVEGRAIGRSRPRKWLSGVFHNQEYERFISFMCLTFGSSTMYGQLSSGAVAFQSALGPANDGTGGDIKKSGLVSAQKGSVSVSAKTSLAFEDTIPVYDGRKIRVNFKTDLRDLSRVLPRFDAEIPFGSFVLVGYTATTWTAVPGSATDKVKHAHLGCNVMWAIVVGIM